MKIKNLKSKIAFLPKNPGVYVFKDSFGSVVYVGKATNLRSRVGSYFSGTRNRNRPIYALIHEVKDIAVQETESVLEALILEANLIKKYQPKYNVMGKDDKSFSYFVITKEDFPRVLIMRETDLNQNPKPKTQNPKRNKKGMGYGLRFAKIFGPYTSKKQMEVALKIIRKIFPFHSQNTKTEKGCLDFQLGRCPGPYAEAISKKYYTRNIRGIQLILEGKKKSLIAILEKEMKKYAKAHKFEGAAELRNRLFALKHIRDVALLTAEDSVLTSIKTKSLLNFRIEAYDISNISGQQAVGSMAVFVNLAPDKNQYRKFKIKTVAGNDDVGMMREVLFRRFRNNWPQPNMVILDGGKGHLNMAQKLLKDLGLIIPTVAVAKGPNRKNLNLQLSIPNEFSMIKFSKEIKNILDNKNLIKQIMDETHRFAITYHRKIRQQEFI